MKTITPKPEEIEKRTARFDDLSVLPAIQELDIPLEIKDVIYSRKLLPAIVPDEGTTPIAAGDAIRGAAGMTMTFAVCPPGTGPGLHTHGSTYETFVVMKSEFEVSWGDHGEHQVALGLFDVLSLPPGICRSFKNTGTEEGVLQVLISGGVHDMNDIAFTPKTADEIAAYNPEYLEAFKKAGFAFNAGQ